LPKAERSAVEAMVRLAAVAAVVLASVARCSPVGDFDGIDGILTPSEVALAEHPANHSGPPAWTNTFPPVYLEHVMHTGGSMLCCELRKQRGCECDPELNCKVDGVTHTKFLGFSTKHSNRGFMAPSITRKQVNAGFARAPELCGVIAREPLSPVPGLVPELEDWQIYRNNIPENGFWRAYTTTLIVGPTDNIMRNLVPPDGDGKDKMRNTRACNNQTIQYAKRAMDHFEVVLNIKDQFDESQKISQHKLGLTLPDARAECGGNTHHVAERVRCKSGTVHDVDEFTLTGCDAEIYQYAKQRVSADAAKMSGTPKLQFQVQQVQFQDAGSGSGSGP